MPKEPKICGCGKGHASDFDGLCRYCREDRYCGTRREMKLYRVRNRGDGLSVEQLVSVQTRKTRQGIDYSELTLDDDL